MFFKMALRNVFRNRRRSLISIAAIGCGILTMISLWGLLDGIGRQSEINLIDMQLGHFQVFNQGYYDNPMSGLKDAITDPDKLMAELKKVDYFRAGAQRLVVPSVVNYQGNEMPCMAIGIDLSEDESVFKLAPWVVEGEGEYLTEGPHVMIGERMAKTLEAEAGGSLVWRARALGKEGGGSIQAELLKIEGIINTGNPAIDGAAIFIPLDYMQKSLLAEDRVTQVAVRIDSTDHLDKALESARNVLAPLGFEIKSWEDMGRAFLELHRLKLTGNMIMVGVFLLIVMVGIINSMLMATYERVQEIGMLMAMGLRAREVRRLFLAEGAVLGMIGSTLGIALGAPLVWLMEVYGIPIDYFTGGQDVDMGYPIRGVMYGDLSLELVLVSFLGGVLIAMAASAFPAWRASRLNPTEALRHV